MTDSNQQDDESSIKDSLKELLEDISIYIDQASDKEHHRLLSSLQELLQSDRRQHPRKPCSIPVTLASWRVFTELIKNISAGGVFVETSEPFSTGEAVSLMFSIPNHEEQVKITGRIAWRTPGGVGVEFTGGSKDLKETIASL